MESSTPLMDTIPMNNLDRDREGERRKKNKEKYMCENERISAFESMGKQISETKIKNSCEVTVTIIWAVIFLEAFKWVGELLNENMVWLMNPVRRDRFWLMRWIVRYALCTCILSMSLVPLFVSRRLIQILEYRFFRLLRAFWMQTAALLYEKMMLCKRELIN